MLLYLVQHGEAKKEEEDPSRPLSEKGFKDIKKVADHARRMDLKVDLIFHSTKTRAQETAAVLSEQLKPTGGVSETDGLAPLDDPNIWSERLINKTDKIMLVGHLPHLGRLASLLLCHGTDRNIIAFRMAGIVCLKRDESGMWSLQWMITPETVI